MNITVTGQFHVPPSSTYDFLYVISNFVFYIFTLHLKTHPRHEYACLSS